MGTALQMHEDLQMLRHWAPEVLNQGSGAANADLAEVIGRRARMDEGLMDYPEVFMEVLRVDDVCSPLCHNLLYLTKTEAEEAAESWGGSLSAVSWFGVHYWEVFPVLESWAPQIPLVFPAHPAEVLRAFTRLSELKGRHYVNHCFYTPEGTWRTDPEPEERIALQRLILEDRHG